MWKANIDWVAETFRDYGYTMVCTDGWIDGTQKITPHGYIVSQADDWEHDWAWWANYLKAKGMQLGVYYNPLWATKSAVTNPSVTVVGRPDVKVGDIVNANDYFDGGGQLQWVDATRDGAEEYVKGYVAYFRELGAVFLRIDFLAYYETGFDQNDGTVGVDHGRDGYLRALQWIWEAAEGMQISLVMPNLFDHGAAERQFGDLIRIGNDASFGTWFNLSGGRETWQPEWSQWNNPFLGFTGFADISGRGQMILDGDPLIMSSFTRDEERQSAINLFTLAGAAIAITDQVDTIGDNAHIFQNQEVLALRKAGLVGKPVFNNSHAFDYDPTSRDSERWIGQLPDGSWAVALFNRADDAAGVTKSIDFADVLGFTGPAAVRDLWAHQDLGSMTSYQVSLGPHASALLSVVPQGAVPLPGRRGRLGGLGRFENTFGGHEGMGYVTGLETVGSSVAVAISVPEGRESAPCVPRGQRHRDPVRADRARARPRHGPRPRHSHPRRAERVGLDLLASRAGHAAHGGRHQPRGVQRRIFRPGRGQSRLRRLGLRSARSGVEDGPQRPPGQAGPPPPVRGHGVRRRRPRHRAVRRPRRPQVAQQCGQRQFALARQQPRVQRGLQGIRLGHGRRIAQLDAQDRRARDGAEQRAVGPAAEVMPGVEHEASVGAVGPTDDLPCSRQIGNAGPWQELQMDEQAVLSRPVAQPGEGRRGLVERPGAAEHVDRVQRARPHCVGDREQLPLAEAEDPFLVEFGRNTDVGRAGGPPPRGVELGHRHAVVGQQQADVLIAEPLVTRRSVVAPPERQSAEAAGLGRGQPFPEGGPARMVPEQSTVSPAPRVIGVPRRGGMAWPGHAAAGVGFCVTIVPFVFENGTGAHQDRPRPRA